MTIDDVKTYLGAAVAAEYDDAVLTSALAAEKAAQARVCRIVGDASDDLREALKRRTVRNLAMRRLPLGVTGDEIATRISSTDPEVRRLEAPYRKLVKG